MVTAPGHFSLYIPRPQPATIRIPRLAKRSDPVLAGHSLAFLGFEVICYCIRIRTSNALTMFVTKSRPGLIKKGEKEDEWDMLGKPRDKGSQSDSPRVSPKTKVQ